MNEDDSVAGESSPLMAFLLGTADAVAADADRLNELDGVAGDGDLGVTATRVAVVLREVAPEAARMPVPAALTRCGAAIARGAASTSGTLVAGAFLAAGKLQVDGLSPAAEAAARLHAAREAIATRGRVEPGDRTMLDALGPADDAFRSAVEEGRSITQALGASAGAADAGAAATAEMEATVGRAGWLSERAIGHEDAGARLVALAFAAAAARAEESS